MKPSLIVEDQRITTPTVQLLGDVPDGTTFKGVIHGNKGLFTRVQLTIVQLDFTAPPFLQAPLFRRIWDIDDSHGNNRRMVVADYQPVHGRIIIERDAE